MNNKITICTVCADDFEIINKNISYIENNNKINIEWLITINQYFLFKENNLKLKSNIKYLKGFLSGEIESPSLDHSIGLNKTIDLIKTRYVIFLDPDFGKGFYKLPKPDDGDVFFDIEGFPRMDRPFEYLHGLYYREKGKLKFKALWAKKFDRESEKNIFIELINFITCRYIEKIVITCNWIERGYFLRASCN